MKREEPSSRSLEARSSGQWYEHYLRNAASRLRVPWSLRRGANGARERGAELTPREKQAVGASLQAWQLGETSDGRHLLAAARRYAARQQDPLFIEVVRLFIKEEQRHGSELGRFLDAAGIPRVTRDWGDTLFRAFRYCLPSIEIWVTLVIMVETLALLFYRAVRDATGSKVLRRICDQILRDEVHHIRFQYERLAILLRRRPRPVLRATWLLHRVLFAGIALAVWAAHHRAFIAGGFHFRSYWRAAWLRMRFAWRRMDPARYLWDDALLDSPHGDLAAEPSKTSVS